ncbi:acyl-CoA dehydratase activase [Acidobacteriota bacterium]
MPEIEVPEFNGTSCIGVDIGSLYFKAVGLRPDGTAAWHFKNLHQGNPLPILDRFLTKTRETEVKIGISSKVPLKNFCTILDPIVCLHSAVQNVFPDSKNILEIGASNLALVRLGTKGQVLSIHTNSLCAAGTGSFLDTQAERMGIDYKKEDDSALPADIPQIATRCAVFAKSDLVYRQQEGFDTKAMWSGLCRGLTDNLLHTLTRGNPLSGQTILCGGVALNTTFVWWLNNKLNANSNAVELKVMPNPEYTVALGAALLGSNNRQDRISKGQQLKEEEGRKRRPPLRIIHSRFREREAIDIATDDQGNEITLHYLPEDLGEAVDVYLGLDIGSTSTKLSLVDDQERLMIDIYRRTEGDPILATQKIFTAVMNRVEHHHIKLNLKGAATTGSGRKLVGKIIGADHVVNEISAHVSGATNIDPDVETIFEIGGQDAKYMSIKNNHIVDANMNYVCAAGTGSFVEELASKLGYRIEDIGKAALGAEPPYTSTRCTVFMEQDVLRLLQRGITRPEAAAAIMYSVIENYLEQVVGQRPVSKERVFFQGATARNPGLIAAIENLLGVEVVASPHCHVMGAYGAALLVRDKMNGQKSRFRGLDLGTRKIVLTSEECGLCLNKCSLSRAAIESEKDRPVWGMKCGREENDTQQKIPDEFTLFQKTINLTVRPNTKAVSSDQELVVTIPYSLSTLSFYPFWKSFFDTLGVKTKHSQPIDRACIEQGNECTGTDFCLPVKAAIGQASLILKDRTNDKIFIPHMMADYELPGFTHTRFCPYVEALPSLLKAVLKDRDPDGSRVISPVIDLHLSDRSNAKEIREALKPIISLNLKDVERALVDAHQARRDYEAKLHNLGESKLSQIHKTGKPAIVVIGRPYNTLDNELNQNIPRFIAECGFDTIPMNCLPWKPDLLQGEFKNCFWSYGQRIISALIQVAQTEGLYAVYLSNFGCGPDSFLLTYAETIMGKKPFLILELDEHGSSGGYQTRVEAFLDVISSDWTNTRSSLKNWTSPAEPTEAESFKKRTVWIPPMHSVSNRLFAATFRGQGYDARTLPVEDEASFALGKRWTRGSECLPAALTLGTFLKQMQKEKDNGADPDQESALFLPTSDGPCRFGQYRTLNRIVCDQTGLKNLPILSPGAHNAYYGLEQKLRGKLWESILAADILFKIRSKTFPYECNCGDTEEVLERSVRKAEKLIEANRINWDIFLREAMQEFMRIPVDKKPRPLVGVVGEIYVRCNAYANSRVIESIEKLGGEAWLSPLSEWILYTAWMERFLAGRNESSWREKLELAFKWRFLSRKEHVFYKNVRPLLYDRTEPSLDATIKAAQKLLPVDFEGESILTLGRAILFKANGADLVVNCSPFGCMHGNITSTLFEQIREDIEIPVLNFFYDGVEDNAILAAFLHQVAGNNKSKQHYFT